MNRSKYRAVPTVVDNIRFASKAEANKWCELRLLEKRGDIFALKRQVPFILSVHDKKIAAIWDIGKYIADFVYHDRTKKPWRIVVMDVKGFRTDLYKWKKKHFEAQYGIKITEVK